MCAFFRLLLLKLSCSLIFASIFAYRKQFLLTLNTFTVWWCGSSCATAVAAAAAAAAGAYVINSMFYLFNGVGEI